MVSMVDDADDDFWNDAYYDAAAAAAAAADDDDDDDANMVAGQWRSYLWCLLSLMAFPKFPADHNISPMSVYLWKRR